MLKQFYTNIAVALKRTASEVFTNSPQQKHNVSGWNKDVREKNKDPRQSYLYWILICIKSLSEVPRNLNMH